MTTQIFCFLLKFFSVKVPSNQNLYQIKQQMQTKRRSWVSKQFQLVIGYAANLREKVSLMLILIHEFKFEICAYGKQAHVVSLFGICYKTFVSFLDFF